MQCMTINTLEAKTHLSRLLWLVRRAGDEFTITCRGVPVAKLVPITDLARPEPQEKPEQS